MFKESAFNLCWKRLSKEKLLNRYDMALYAILKGTRRAESEKDDITAYRTDGALALAQEVDIAPLQIKWSAFYLKKAFTPVTKKTKLDSGREPYDTLKDATLGVEGSMKGEWWKPVNAELMSTLSDEEKSLVLSLCSAWKECSK